MKVGQPALLAALKLQQASECSFSGLKSICRKHDRWPPSKCSPASPTLNQCMGLPAACAPLGWPLWCRLKLAGHANRKDCAAVILYAAEHATRMALDAIQILGGNG